MEIMDSKAIEQGVEWMLVGQGYEILARNKKFAGVEVDRLLRKVDDGVFIVCEIKSISDWKYLDSRVHPFQKKRLSRARDLLQSWQPEELFLLYYAFYHYTSGELRMYDELGDEVLVVNDAVFL